MQKYKLKRRGGKGKNKEEKLKQDEKDKLQEEGS